MNNAHHLLRGSSSNPPHSLNEFYSCYTLRNEMLHFISNLQYYMMFQVLECSWDELHKRMKAASDLDQVRNLSFFLFRSSSIRLQSSLTPSLFIHL